MDDKQAPARRHARWLVAATAAGALTLGLAAPAGALRPPVDDIYDPVYSYDPPSDFPVATTPEYPLTPPPAQDPVPAPAPPAPPAPAPPPAPDPQPAPTPAPQTETAQQKAERQINEAIEDVRRLLADPACAALIGRWPNNYPTGLSALDVFEAILAANPRQFFNEYNDTLGNAFAGSTPVGSGPAGTIAVFKPFHEAEPGVQYTITVNGAPFTFMIEDTYNTYTRDYSYQLTGREFRALALLHELRHIQGNLDQTHNADPSRPSEAENEAIVDKCFPNATRVPRPPETQVRPAVPDLLPELPAPVINGLPDADPGEPPLNPHGSDPVITVDGQELPGGYYSDDPVIRGEDGSVIEGGEVGPYPDPPADTGVSDDPYDPGYDEYYDYDYGYFDEFYVEELAD